MTPPLPGHTRLYVSMVGKDTPRAFTPLAASQSEFNRWLEQLQETTGRNLCM
jgi:hypothetical protein